MRTRILFAIFLCLLAFIFLGSCKEKISEEAEIVQESGEGELVGEEGEEVSVEINIPVAVTTDCGEKKECFEEKFAVCEPAKMTLRLSSKLGYAYEILSQENGLCQIKSEFIANPNPAFVGKTMTCLYDNSKTFNDAAAEIIQSFNTDQHLGSCEGDLYELMTSFG